MDRKSLTTGEVANILGRSRGWVRDQIKQGRIRPSLGGKGSHYRISADEFERFVRQLLAKYLENIAIDQLARQIGVSKRHCREYYFQKC